MIDSVVQIFSRKTGPVNRRHAALLFRLARISFRLASIQSSISSDEIKGSSRADRSPSSMKASISASRSVNCRTACATSQDRERSYRVANWSSVSSVAASSRVVIGEVASICHLYHLYTNDSRTRLTAPAHQPFIRRQPFERDRSPGMQAPRRDADFGAEAEFAAVGELGRGIVHDNCAVDAR